MQKTRLGLDQPGRYEIRVQGRLDTHWADWFDDMVLCPRQEVDGLAVTVLTGVVVDQAALLGLLQKLYHLGLPLLELRWTGPDCAVNGRGAS